QEGRRRARPGPDREALDVSDRLLTGNPRRRKFPDNHLRARGCSFASFKAGVGGDPPTQRGRIGAAGQAPITKSAGSSASRGSRLVRETLVVKAGVRIMVGGLAR